MCSVCAESLCSGKWLYHQFGRKCQDWIISIRVYPGVAENYLVTKFNYMSTCTEIHCFMSIQDQLLVNWLWETCLCVQVRYLLIGLTQSKWGGTQ